METRPGDEWTERLAKLFAEHPAWIAAAQLLSSEATSTVFFRHRPGAPWRLEPEAFGGSRLRVGASPDPDLVFRFSTESIERLEAVDGGIGDFAVALFEQIVDENVDLRIRARFTRLTWRGYVRLLLAAGPPVLIFGAKHGVRTLGALRRFVVDLRSRGTAEWETMDADTPTSTSET